jgi:hypothetical protein
MLAAVPAGDEAAAPVGYAVLSIKTSMASCVRGGSRTVT